MNPKVSINLCCYNSEKYLRETLDSIVGQTYKDWELIIINDGSSDATADIIGEYKGKGLPLVYHHQENKGLGYSRTEALKRSHGEYIAFIDHDDLWLPDKLASQVNVLEDHPEVDFVYSNYFAMKGTRKTLATRKRLPQGDVFERFLCHYPVAILTVMVRKKAIDRLDDFFDINLALAEEYDLFMRLLYRSQAIYLDKPTAVYRLHAGMNSFKSMGKWPDEIAYVLKKLGSLYPNLEHDYASAISSCKLEMEYARAKMFMEQGDLRSARRQIKPYKFITLKYFIILHHKFGHGENQE